MNPNRNLNLIREKHSILVTPVFGSAEQERESGIDIVQALPLVAENIPGIVECKVSVVYGIEQGEDGSVSYSSSVELVLLKPTEVPGSSKYTHRPWCTRAVAQALLLRFYHKKELRSVRVTAGRLCQVVTRENTGWQPCFHGVEPKPWGATDACACEDIAKTWTLEDRDLYAVRFAREWSDPDTQAVLYSDLPNSSARHAAVFAAWIFQGLSQNPKETLWLEEEVGVECAIPKGLIKSREFAIPVLLLTEPVQGQGYGEREQEYNAFVEEEPCVSAELIRIWVRYWTGWKIVSERTAASSRTTTVSKRSSSGRASS